MESRAILALEYSSDPRGSRYLQEISLYEVGTSQHSSYFRSLSLTESELAQIPTALQMYSEPAAATIFLGSCRSSCLVMLLHYSVFIIDERFGTRGGYT